MTDMLTLECFDKAEFSNSHQHPEYLRGYLEGLEAGKDQFSVEQSALNGEIVAVFSDAIFSYAEARQAVLSELEPILRAIPRNIIPTLVIAGVTTTIEDILTAAVAATASQKPTVLVNPEMFAILARSDFGPERDLFELAENTNVPQFAAWLKTPNGDTAIDFENVTTAISVALENYTNPTHRNKEHG